MVRNYSLLVSVVLVVSGCGYQPPLDQCVGSGTKCEEREVIRGEKGDSGPAGRDGERGLPGRDGRDGVDGRDGQDGNSCSATRVSNGVTITCGDTVTVLFDGQNGEDGQDSPPTAYSIVEMRDPCGDQSGFDEVLLKTASGKWIAHFSSGSNQFLTVLTPGNYQTTDSTRCRFSVDNEGNIINEYNY